MSRIFSRPGGTAGLVGALTTLQVAALGLLGSATTTSVSFLGRELNWGCSFKQTFGIPCPNCGMTRSVLLTLRGHLGDAFTLNPAGPLLVFGTLLFSFAMFYLMFCQRGRASDESLRRLQRRIKHGAIAYAALLIFVWTAQWLYAIS
ncbi:MAG TPA: DUF2752 domain-containing protein [Pyrinomonadaceae bacterium]|jgi:hypothetical protein